jgi:hypothetical protein
LKLFDPLWIQPHLLRLDRAGIWEVDEFALQQGKHGPHSKQKQKAMKRDSAHYAPPSAGCRGCLPHRGLSASRLFLLG